MDKPMPEEYWWVHYADEWQPAQCDELGWWLGGLDVLVQVDQVGSKLEKDE